jgi:hypothetical protein
MKVGRNGEDYEQVQSSQLPFSQVQKHKVRFHFLMRQVIVVFDVILTLEFLRKQLLILLSIFNNPFFRNHDS